MSTPLTVNMNYTIVLTTQQFRVVMACLRAGAEDTELKAEWRPEAASIQDMLFRARNVQVREQLAAIQRMQGDENESEETEEAEDSGSRLGTPIAIRGAAGSAKLPAGPVNRNHTGGRHGS